MTESTTRSPGPVRVVHRVGRLLRRVVRWALVLMVAFVAGIAVMTWIGVDDIPVTPSPEPDQVVALVEGPRTGCGRYKSVWDARTRGGEVTTICDHTGGPFPLRGRTRTSFEIGDHVAVGPGSFLQMLPGRVAVTFVCVAVAGALVWLASAMAPQRESATMTLRRRRP